MQVGVLVLVLFAGGLIAALIVIAARRERPDRGQQPDQPPSAPVDRRQFLNRTLLGSLSLFAVAMGAGSVGYIWPSRKRETFGSKVTAGRFADILAELDRNKRIYNARGKFYLVRYEGIDPEFYARNGVLGAGVMAIFQKCSHLGCRVPYCRTSDLFECPCHGARFNRAGEWRNGPAPASLWRFPIEIVEGRVVVDTSRPVAQTAAGYDTLGPRTGAYCVSD
jgi:cytochrome b6-f complex iron-sulfur subunit